LLEESSYKELEFVKMMKDKVEFPTQKQIHKLSPSTQYSTSTHSTRVGTPQKDQMVERKKPHSLEWNQDQQDKR
jgi:hypothetical protein